MDAEYLYDRALIAYFRYYKKKGIEPQQPSFGSSEISPHGIIKLRNMNGVLAIYRYNEKNDRLIKAD